MNPRSSVFLLSIILVLIIVGFLIGRFANMPFLPQIPNYIPLLALCSVGVIFNLTGKKLLGLAYTSFLIVGLGLGFVLNDLLSVNFLVEPSSLSLLMELTIIIVALFAVFWKEKGTRLYDKLRCLFLGVSLISLLFALSVFVYMVQSYLPLYPQEETVQIIPKFSVIVNIFKSLFLTGLFSFFERFLRIMEEDR